MQQHWSDSKELVLVLVLFERHQLSLQLAVDEQTHPDAFKAEHMTGSVS